MDPINSIEEMGCVTCVLYEASGSDGSPEGDQNSIRIYLQYLEECDGL